jgi:hypothetical protein
VWGEGRETRIRNPGIGTIARCLGHIGKPHPSTRCTALRCNRPRIWNTLTLFPGHRAAICPEGARIGSPFRKTFVPAFWHLSQTLVSAWLAVPGEKTSTQNHRVNLTPRYARYRFYTPVFLKTYLHLNGMAHFHPVKSPTEVRSHQ